MSRRRAAKKKEILPDHKFKDRILTKFMNRIMLAGKKSVAENVVYGALQMVSEKTKEKEISEIKAKYIKTRKNEQVKNFYDKCSFDLIDENESIRDYILNTSSYKPRKLNYIEVISG